MPILCHYFETRYFYLKFRHSLSLLPSPLYILPLCSLSVLTVSSEWVTIKLPSLSLASLLLIIFSSTYCQLHMDIPKKPLITVLYTFMFLILVNGITVLSGHLAENPRIIFVPLFVHSIFEISLTSSFPFCFHSYLASLAPTPGYCRLLFLDVLLNANSTTHWARVKFLKYISCYSFPQKPLWLTDTHNNLFALP